MTRTMVTAGLALAVSAGMALAADYGKGRKLAVAEQRFDRGHALTCERFYADLAVRFHREERADERCKLLRAYRPGIWRGYPQSR